MCPWLSRERLINPSAPQQQIIKLSRFSLNFKIKEIMRERTVVYLKCVSAFLCHIMAKILLISPEYFLKHRQRLPNLATLAVGLQSLVRTVEATKYLILITSWAVCCIPNLCRNVFFSLKLHYNTQATISWYNLYVANSLGIQFSFWMCWDETTNSLSKQHLSVGCSSEEKLVTLPSSDMLTANKALLPFN